MHREAVQEVRPLERRLPGGEDQIGRVPPKQGAEFEDQGRLVPGWPEDRLREGRLVDGRLKGGQPKAPAQTVGALLDHHHPGDVDDLEAATQEKLVVADLLH